MSNILKTRSRMCSPPVSFKYIPFVLPPGPSCSDGISGSYLKTQPLPHPHLYFQFLFLKKIQKMLMESTRIIALETGVLFTFASLVEHRWQQSICVPPSHSVVLNVSEVTGPPTLVMVALLQLVTAILLRR